MIPKRLLQCFYNDLTALKRDPSRPYIPRTSHILPRMYSPKERMVGCMSGTLEQQLRVNSQLVVPLPIWKPHWSSPRFSTTLFCTASLALLVEFEGDASIVDAITSTMPLLLRTLLSASIHMQLIPIRISEYHERDLETPVISSLSISQEYFVRLLHSLVKDSFSNFRQSWSKLLYYLPL